MKASRAEAQQAEALKQMASTLEAIEQRLAAIETQSPGAPKKSEPLATAAAIDALGTQLATISERLTAIEAQRQIIDLEPGVLVEGQPPATAEELAVVNSKLDQVLALLETPKTTKGSKA